MLIGDKLGLVEVLSVLGLFELCVDVAEGYAGDGHGEGQDLPQAVAT